jgi:hypothetical protein
VVVVVVVEAEQPLLLLRWPPQVPCTNPLNPPPRLLHPLLHQ